MLILKTLSSLGCNQDTCKFKEAEYFKSELKSFVDSVKPNSIGNGKYDVYVAHFYHLDPENKEFCFTLGYIFNEYDVQYISPDYVYYVDNEIILIRMDKHKDKKFFNCLNFKKIEESDSVKIASKLYPMERGGITGTTEGLIFCKEKEKISKTYYENSDEIPLEKSIDKYFPEGGTIELIED